MIDLTPFLNKISNDGATPEGELTSEEFVTIIRAIRETQGGVKKIIRNNVEFVPNAQGVIEMTIHADSELPTVRLATSDNQEYIISTDGSVVLHLRYTSFLTTGGVSEDTGNDGILLIQRRASSSDEWMDAGTVAMAPKAYNSDAYDTVDISSLLLDGDQQVRLRVTDTDANVSSPWVVFASIIKTTLALEFTSSWQNAIEGGEGASTILTYVLFGAVSKDLHLLISGEASGGVASTREIIVANSVIASYTGRNNPYNYTLQDLVSEACKIMSVHGVHTIEAWLQATADSSIQSEHVFSQIFIDCDPTDEDVHIVLQNIRDTAVNYVTADLLKYAVFSRRASSVPLEFSVGNYAETEEYMHFETNAQTGAQHTLSGTIEVEGNGNASIPTYLRITSDGTDVLTPAIGDDLKLITVDNSVNYAPTSGADFFLNPKARSNAETNPARILNAAQSNAPVAADFSGLGFVNDGWMKDAAGQQCLRLLAGQSLHITGYEPYQAYITAGQRYNNQQASVTIEMDIAVRNVTNEDDPIIRMCSYLTADNKPLGLEMRPLEGVFMTRSQRTAGQQDFSWQEGKRTHIAINCYYNLGAAAANETQVSYVRVFINGKIEREFLFDHVRSNEFWQNDTQGNPSSGGIRIGQDGADIDIYSIRIYQKALSSDEVMQDYVSTLPDASDKVLFKTENDIMQDGVISYSKASAKYNVIVWHGEPVSGHNESTKADKAGWLYIQMRGSDGTVDAAHSGTLTGMKLKGQGTTAKHYYEWNDQWQWKEKNVGSFVDLNGNDKGQKYQLYDGLPWAKKLVGKINYASSMQSHKAGACNLYNDLYHQIVSDWGVTRVSGYANTRVAVPELPVLYFVQTEEDNAPVFQGLMTFGPGKADKPTWGYDEEEFPDMAMMEGSDNNFPLTDCRVPWTDEDVTYNADEEYFEYNGEGNIDFDLGRTTEEDDGAGSTVDVPHPDIVDYYKAAWNHCFRWNCLINYYDGTLEQLKSDTNVNPRMFYWVTQASASAAKFDLFRLEYQGKDASNNDITEWVPAGLTKTNGVWDTLNLMEDTPVSDTSIWASMNADFIAARTAQWKAGVGSHFSVLSLLFNHEFMKLFAGTDNRSKNTYYVLDPTTHKIHLHGDDLDTIMKTNNTGWQLKPYYIEERDTDSDGNTYWEGQYNVIFDLLERAYAEQLPQMMNTILSTMSSLVGSGARDRAGNLIPQTPDGCIQKYFYSVQEYFPAVAYNETARIRYEAAQLAVARGDFTAPDGINPITQSLGSQLEAERQYMKRRLVYLSSYAAYGEFAASTTTGALSIRGMKNTDGTDASMILTIKPHQWLYPTGATGGTLVNPHVRLAPGGRLVDAQGHPYGADGYQFNIGTIVGDTSCKLSGINYMRSIGNVAALSTNPAYSFTVSGERLVEFIAEPGVGETAQFRPSSIAVTAPLIRHFSLKGCSLIAGECPLAALTRLVDVDLRDTGIVGTVLPQTETLTSAKLPASLVELAAKNTPNLATFTVQGYSHVATINFGVDHGSFDSQVILSEAFAAEAPITAVTLLGIEWTNTQAALIDWIAQKSTAVVTGSAAITGTNTAVTFAMKKLWMERWGAVDDESNELYLTYTSRSIGYALVLGNPTLRTIGQHPFSVTPATSGGVSTAYGNNFKGIAWSLSTNSYATVDPDTGIVTMQSVGPENADGTGPTATLTCTVTLLDDTTVVATKVLNLFDRTARPGDYVFYDGEYSPEYDGTKTAIGICFWVNPNNRAERLMVAMRPISSSLPWGLYEAANNANAVNGIEIEGGYDAYDTPLPNNTTSGIVATSEGGTNNYISDPTYRDESELGDADGFRVFADGTCAAKIGFMTLAQDFHGLPAGSRIPIGLYETLSIIDHRDRVLEGLDLNIPAATSQKTEAEDLADLIAAIQADQGAAKYQQIYFPAASYAYAFEPTILRSSERLADRFKAHNWFLPAFGDLCRLYWYHSKGYAGAEHAIFSDGSDNNLFTKFTASNFWTSQEFSRQNAWYINFSAGNVYYFSKYNTIAVRAVSAF